jgi:hypothetical protein
LLPGRGRNESGFAKDISKKLPKEILFRKDDLIVEVSKPEDTGRTGLRFDVMTAWKFTTWVEQFVTTGSVAEPESGEKQFFEQTMKDTQAAHALEGPTFGASLPRIDRILDVPIPVLVSSKVLYPEPGYNKSLKLYCDTTAPKIEDVTVEEAKRIILEEVYGEFCFKDEQSRTHAVARLITPYCRGLIGFQNRTPFWYFDANRPGAGKDYCNEVSQMVYLGHSAEDAPIGECSEETRKRITAALVSGRRMMHFANCQVHLSDQNFIQAITNSTLRVRMLGSTSATADLELANEIEFSISANIGLTCREDIERRCRRITLEYFEEHENSRQFKKPNLTQWVLENRGRILGAIHALVKAWLDAGSPNGKTPFTSFPEWSTVVGGVMEFHGLGNPCQPNVSGLLGGDLKSKAMSALYELAFGAGPDEWWTKQQMFSLIAENQENDDRLDFFGDLDSELYGKKNRTKAGIFLKEFNRRNLGGIVMTFDTSSSKSERHRMMFTKG